MSKVIVSFQERYSLRWTGGRAGEGEPSIRAVKDSSVIWKPEPAPIHDVIERALHGIYRDSNRSFSRRLGVYRGYLGKKPLESYALYYTYGEFDGHRNDYSNALVVAVVLPEDPQGLVCSLCGSTNLFLGKEISDVVVSSNLTVMHRIHKNRELREGFTCKNCGGPAERKHMELLSDGSFPRFAYG